MSADAWRVCPRCRAKGDIGIRGTEFREDYEIGINDPDSWLDEEGKDPVLIINYRGECQSCGLLVEVNERRPIDLGLPAPEPNQPTGFVVTKPWKIIPAGWFVRAKASGPWYEVLATRRVGASVQGVKLRMPDGSGRDFLYDPDVEVKCRRGTLAPSSVEHALKVLGEGAEIIQDPAEDGS